MLTSPRTLERRLGMLISNDDLRSINEGRWEERWLWLLGPWELIVLCRCLSRDLAEARDRINQNPSNVTVQSPTLSRAWFAFLRRLTPPDGGEQRMLGAAPVLRLSQEIADHR
jgi:hypothetical protein